MATNADVAAQVLRNCAEFFSSVGEQNPSIKNQMESNAEACTAAAQLVEEDPTGSSPLSALPEEGGPAT